MSALQPSAVDATSLPPSTRDLRAAAPKVAPLDAACSRMIGRGLRLPTPDPALCWLVLPGAADAQGHWLLLDSAAGPLYLQDGVRFLAGLTGIDGGDGEWPSWMAGAVAGRLGGTPLAGVRAVRPCGAPPAGLLLLRWRLQQASHAIETLAAADPAVWTALFDGAGTQPLRMPLGPWLTLTFDWPLLLATHRLPLALYETLAAGDVILPDGPRFDTAGAGRIGLGRRRWNAAFTSPGRLQLLNEENSMHTDLDDADVHDNHVLEHDTGLEADDAAMASDAAASAVAMLGSVSLTLRFELGRTRMTLDQLRALGPNSILDVQGGAPHAIAITCGATEVGSGEVVDVDGRLGVRITRWGPAC